MSDHQEKTPIDINEIVKACRAVELEEVKYPMVEIDLDDLDDGNAFAVLAHVKTVMKAHNLSKDQIDEFIDEATSGDYHHLLCTVFRYVDVAYWAMTSPLQRNQLGHAVELKS